jgi:hypothetical protein
MNPDSEIDVEKAAESTLFFSRVIVDGRSQLHSRVNYLALINLHTDVEATVKTIKDIVLTEQMNVLEHDTLLLLQARNWRFHLVACGILLAGVRSTKLLNQLWIILREGSWVVPQIAATVYILDPQFDSRAVEAIEQRKLNEQSLVAIAELLKQAPNMRFTLKQEALIKSARVSDRADSGKIAVSWAEKIRPLFIAT